MFNAPFAAGSLETQAQPNHDNHAAASDATAPGISAHDRQQVRQGIDDLNKNVLTLKQLAAQLELTRRERARQRVAQLEAQLGHLRARFRRFERTHRDAHVGHELFGDSRSRHMSGLRGDQVEMALREDESLNRSRQRTREIEGMARQALLSLQEQGTHLKGARTKMLDIANSLGLSSSLMKIIERRELGDKFLVYAGMIISSLVLFALYWFVIS